MTRQHCPVHGYNVLHVQTKSGPVCARCINARRDARQRPAETRKEIRP